MKCGGRESDQPFNFNTVSIASQAKINKMHILYVYIAFFGFLLAAGLSAPCQLFAVSDPSCSSLTNWYANPTRFPAWAPNAQRLWEIDDLQRAIQNMGSVEGAARLFDKLNSGKSIIAVAFGSSFVFDAAGCWQSSVDDLRSLSIIPSPILYPLKEVYDLKRHDPDWLEGRCAAGGFMEVLMEWINASYPNPKHQFINNGRGGGTLSMLAEASCISTHTPQHIDLILLDTVTNVGSVAGAEKLLRGLLKGPGGPLTILASNTKHCGPPSYKNETLHIQCNACLRQGGGRDTAACQGLEEPGYTSEDVATHQGVIAPYQALAKHYNIPHLNILSTMARIMTGNARLENNLTKMELLGQIYSDAAHLRRKNGGLGSLLVADILHLYFVLAKKVWDEKKGAVSLVPAPLPPPLHKEARGHYQTRCYGLSAESLRGARDEKGEVVRVNQLSSDAWSDIFGRQGADDPGSQNLFQQLPRLKIRSSEGWDLQGEISLTRQDR